MPMPSEYSYLYDTCDFVWNNTNINTFESGKQIKLTNSGMTPLDITNVSFLAGVDHGGETPFDNATLCPSRMISAYITDNGGTVTVNYSGMQAFWTPYPGDPGICYHFSAYGTSGNYLSCQSPDWYPRTYFNRTTSFSDLSSCCKYIWRNFAHLYIYYNNELWVDPFNPGPIIVYTWQSVPSISGKNGILQNLVQIKDSAINDGEPVSEATVLSFDSLGNINIPSIIDEQMPVDPSDVTSVTATYLIPALENGTYEGIKLLVKKGSIPTSEEDADKVVNLDEPTSILRIDSKSVGNLDEDSHYYFVVKLVDEIGTEATSDPKDIWTSHNEGWSFDYTGQIQTFVAPKTGVYQLETWGAQGGNATDGTLVARGGYGAYAYGEVLLQQGETLYINVGGQNGYGGGGNWQTEEEEMIYSTNEQIVGTYLDETLYQCTFNISSVSGTSSRTYINLVDLSSYNIKRIVSFEGSWSDGTMYKPFTWADTSSIIGDITYNINSKYLQLLNSGFDQASFYDVSITIRYTKNS